MVYFKLLDYITISKFLIKVSFPFRSHIDSLLVLPEDDVARNQKRSLISFQMCFTAWVYESVSFTFWALIPLFNYIGISNVYYLDVILSFVVIPSVYLMNNDDTKQIVLNENWYQGLRHMLGIYTQILPIVTESSKQQQKASGNTVTSNKSNPNDQTTHSFSKPIFFNRPSSAHNFFPGSRLLVDSESIKRKRCNSLGELSSIQVPIQHKKSKYCVGSTKSNQAEAK